MRAETTRLVIRDFRKEDCDDAFEYLSSPAVMEYIEPPFTALQTKVFIQKYGIEEKKVFAVEEKFSKKMIGHIIFHAYNEPLEYEIGWIFNQRYQGKGYAKEVSLALFEHGFYKLHLDRIVAETVWDNKSSVATIESLGMKRSTTHQEKLPIWFITRNDYQIAK